MVGLARVVVTRHPCACMQACMEATYGGNDRHAGMCSMTFASLAPMQIRMQFQMHRQLITQDVHLGDEQVGADKDPPGYCLDDVCGRCTGDNTAGPCIADDGVQVSTQALLIRLCM